MAHDYKNLNGEPNADAMVEACALLCCLYWDDRTRARRIVELMGDGEIASWQFISTSIPPSMMVWTDDDSVNIVITGTTSIDAFGLDAAGYFGTPYGTDGTRVNAFYNYMAEHLKTQVLAVCPGDLSNKKIRVTGHSLGSQCAWLLSLYFTEQYGSSNIQYLGFGTPKGMTRSFAGAQASTNLNVNNQSDYVPYAPELNLSFILNAAHNPIFSQEIDWAHHCELHTLSSNGELNRQVRTFYDLLLGLSPIVGTYTSHPIHTYAESVKLCWIRSS